jgi:hypothetical protein
MHPKVCFFLAIFCFSHFAVAQDSDACAPEVPTAADTTIIAWYTGSSIRVGSAPGRIATRQHLDVGTEPPESEIPDFVWRTQFGPLRTIALIQDGAIEQAGDTAITRGQTMWNVVDDQSVLALTDVHSVRYHYRDGVTWCLFSGDTNRDDIEPNTLFTNDPSFALRQPTEAEQENFDRYIYPDTYCANRSGMFLRDVPPEEIPPCDEPTLIGVSDINEDGRPEFWGTEILKFATQITVWDTARGYTSTFSACPGCAD